MNKLTVYLSNGNRIELTEATREYTAAVTEWFEKAPHDRTIRLTDRTTVQKRHITHITVDTPGDPDGTN